MRERRNALCFDVACLPMSKAKRRPRASKAARSPARIRKPPVELASLVATEVASSVDASALTLDVTRMIESARRQVAQAANAALTTPYWEIGTRIRADVLKRRRAEYGEEIVAALGRQLEGRFGRGFSEKSLRRMVLRGQLGRDQKKVSAPLRQSTGSSGPTAYVRRRSEREKCQRRWHKLIWTNTTGVREREGTR